MGINAIAICDRCGLRYPWQSLRSQLGTDGGNSRVCQECYDSISSIHRFKTRADRDRLPWTRPDMADESSIYYIDNTPPLTIPEVPEED